MGGVSGTGTVTTLLRSWRAGDEDALEQLIPIVYEELRRIAALHLRRERAAHTLHPTDLVAEAYLRLAGGAQPDLADRVHFFAVAARNMRQILVDHARRRTADKRGGGERALTLDEGLIGGERPAELVRLDEALEELAKLDARKARTIELHYFGGLGHAEVAQVLGVHASTVARDLRVGEAWLHRFLRDAPG